MIYFFTLEGLIGGGKSTLIRCMKDRLPFINNIPVRYIQEPVSKWTNYKENNKDIIELFYTDKKRYAFEFQLVILNSFIEQIEEIKRDHLSDVIVLSERSIRTAQYVFQQLLYDNGDISDLQKHILNDLYNKHSYIQHGIIYLNTDTQICIDRINERKRNGENNIDIEYLSKLKKKYETYIYQSSNVMTIYNNSKREIPYIESFIKHTILSAPLPIAH